MAAKTLLRSSLHHSREAVFGLAYCSFSQWPAKKVTRCRRPTTSFPSRSHATAQGRKRPNPNHLTKQKHGSSEDQSNGFVDAKLHRKRLQQETQSILRWCRDNQDAKRSITSDPFFRAMEGWMDYCRHRGGLQYAQMAEKLLHVMENTLSTTALVETKHVDLVLEAYAVCNGGVAAAQAATKILLEHPSSSGRCSPSVKSHNIVLKCWARTTRYRDAGSQTQAILDRMCEQQIWPNERSIVSHFEAWANSGHNQAPEHVTSTLHQLLHETTSHDERRNSNFRDVRVDNAVFHAAMHAWVESGRGRTAAVQAEQILSSMSQHGMTPETMTYSLVISAWKQVEKKERTGYGAKRAEAVFDSLVELYRQGRTEVVPNAIAVTTCIAAWSYVTEQREAPEHAEHLFDRLGNLCAESGYLPSMQPTTSTANAVLSAWSRSRCRSDAVAKALDFLQTRIPEPNVISYNTVLDAMAKRGLGQQALDLFDAIQSSVSTTNIQPDRFTYNSVLAALSRDATFSPHETECFLMERMLANQEDSHIQPDNISYTLVLSAWARSDAQDKVRRAYQLVKGMVVRFRERQGAKPDEFVFCSLIKTCCRAGDTEKEAALGVALQAMEAIRTGEFGPPTETAYALLIRAIRLCTPLKDRNSGNELQEKVIRACSRAGLASQAVLDELGPGVGSCLSKTSVRSSTAIRRQLARLLSGRTMHRNSKPTQDAQV